MPTAAIEQYSKRESSGKPDTEKRFSVFFSRSLFKCDSVRIAWDFVPSFLPAHAWKGIKLTTVKQTRKDLKMLSIARKVCFVLCLPILTPFFVIVALAWFSHFLTPNEVASSSPDTKSARKSSNSKASLRSDSTIVLHISESLDRLAV